MELSTCHPSGAENFEVASKLLENLFTPALDHSMFLTYPSKFIIHIHSSFRFYMTFSAGEEFLDVPSIDLCGLVVRK